VCAVCCSVLQCVAVWFSVLKGAMAHATENAPIMLCTLHCVSVCFCVFPCVAVWFVGVSVLKGAMVRAKENNPPCCVCFSARSALQYFLVCCSVGQCVGGCDGARKRDCAHHAVSIHISVYI